MECFLLPRLHPCGNNVQGDAEAGPHIVVVHAGRHHIDERVVGPNLGSVDDFLLEGMARLAEAVLADELGVHARGDMAERRGIPDGVEVLKRLGGHLCSSGARRPFALYTGSRGALPGQNNAAGIEQ